MLKQEIYDSKLIKAEDALDAIKSNDTIATSLYGNEPSWFLENIHRIAGRVTGVHIWSMIPMHSYKVMSDNKLKGKIDIITFFKSTDARKNHNEGRYKFIPMDLHSVGKYVIETMRPNVFVAAVSPMDNNGNVHISFDLEGSLDWIEVADTVIFEVNKNIPVVFGDTAIPIEKASFLYERDTPIPEAPNFDLSEKDLIIAEYVSSLIQDGDCIQLGIGNMPNAVGMALMSKHDLGIHTEMLTASMGQLIMNGVITNERKNIDKGKTVCAFAFGDKHLYDCIAGNRSISVKPAAYVNNPFIIAQNDNMVSCNTAIQIDLTGQICSESIGSFQFSGTGGACDFAYGAFHSNGGKSIIAMKSTINDDTVSKIQAQLLPGAVVSISRNIADYVVTEYGIAKLRGKTLSERVNNLIAVAHPNFRKELAREANKLMLW